MQPTNQNAKHLVVDLRSRLVNVLHLKLVKLVLFKSLGEVLHSQSNCEFKIRHSKLKAVIILQLVFKILKCGEYSGNYFGLGFNSI